MTPAPEFDLQSHSTISDGSLPPGEVVAQAAQAGVKLLALTDHDAVDGVDEALEAARAHGIRVVPATELSALDAGYEDFHILGYGLDHHSPVLLAALTDFRIDRNLRGSRMAAALVEAGWQLDRSALDAREAAGRPVGRPHLPRSCSITPPTPRASPRRNSATSAP